MSREVLYLDDKDLVVVRTSGSYDLDAEIETVRAAFDKMKEHNCLRCIFDHRKTTVIAKTMGSFQRPDVYKELGLRRSAKVAIVLRELSDEMQFYENVCVNRGWKVRNFDDYDAAVEWLADDNT